MEAILPAMRLLWVDLTADVCHNKFLDTLPQSLIVQRLKSVSQIASAIDERPPHLVCFDFDCPNLQGLEALKSIKLKHPSVPILMLTEQHSEELVLWALRTRVWDYFVKPVNRREFCGRLHTLSRFTDVACSQRDILGRDIHMPQQTVPIQIESLNLSNGLSSTSAAIAHINENYGEKILLGEMARLCRMGPYQFSRAFKRDHGLTFREFLIRYRISKALGHFKQPDVSIIEVVFAVGFNDPSHFSRTFRQYVGMTPSAYRAAISSGHAARDTVDTGVSA